jgi:hypothetical protein
MPMAQATRVREHRHFELHAPHREDIVRDPGLGAFWLLRVGFTVAPILFGIDKFFNWMVTWHNYLWAGVAHNLPGSPTEIMYGVGAVEIIAGLVVLAAPRIGSLLVAGWLGAIITNLVLVGLAENEYWDIALRDFGLFVAAVSLFLLATKYARRPVTSAVSSVPPSPSMS